MAHSFTPWRVDHHQTRREVTVCGSRHRGEVLATNSHNILKAQPTDVLLRPSHRLHIAIVTTNFNVASRP